MSRIKYAILFLLSLSLISCGEKELEKAPAKVVNKDIVKFDYNNSFALITDISLDTSYNKIFELAHQARVELEDQNNAWQMEISKRQLEIDKIKLSDVSIETEIADKLKAIEDTKKEIRDNHKSQESLNSLIRDAKNKLSTMQASLDAPREELKENTLEAAELKQMLDKEQEYLRSAPEKIKDEHSRLSAAIVASQKQLSVLEEEISSIQSTLDNKESPALVDNKFINFVNSAIKKLSDFKDKYYLDTKKDEYDKEKSKLMSLHSSEGFLLLGHPIERYIENLIKDLKRQINYTKKDILENKNLQSVIKKKLKLVQSEVKVQENNVNELVKSLEATRVSKSELKNQLDNELSQLENLKNRKRKVLENAIALNKENEQTLDKIKENELAIELQKQTEEKKEGIMQVIAEYKEHSLPLLEKLSNNQSFSFNALLDNIIKQNQTFYTGLNPFIIKDTSAEDLDFHELKDFIYDLAHNSDKNLENTKHSYQTYMKDVLDLNIKYNKDHSTIANPLKEQRIQCYSGTSTFNLVDGINTGGVDYKNSNRVIILESGHILPGFITKGENGYELTGIEATANGRALIRYGDTKTVTLRKELRVFDAFQYLVANTFKWNLTDKCELREKMFAFVEQKYGFDVQAMKDLKECNTSSSATLINHSLYSFGQDSTPAGDRDMNEFDQQGVGIQIAVKVTVVDGRQAKPAEGSNPEFDLNYFAERIRNNDFPIPLTGRKCPSNARQITFLYYGSQQMFERKDGEIKSHEEVGGTSATDQRVRDRLISILNSAESFYSVNEYTVEVDTKDSKRYVLNLSLPLFANPVRYIETNSYKSYDYIGYDCL